MKRKFDYLLRCNFLRFVELMEYLKKIEINFWEFSQDEFAYTCSDFDSMAVVLTSTVSATSIELSFSSSSSSSLINSALFLIRVLFFSEEEEEEILSKD